MNACPRLDDFVTRRQALEDFCGWLQRQRGVDDRLLHEYVHAIEEK